MPMSWCCLYCYNCCLLFCCYLFFSIWYSQILTIRDLVIDWFTFFMVLWNFGCLGLMVIHWKGPLRVQQAYLIVSSALVVSGRGNLLGEVRWLSSTTNPTWGGGGGVTYGLRALDYKKDASITELLLWPMRQNTHKFRVHSGVCYLQLITRSAEVYVFHSCKAGMLYLHKLLLACVVTVKYILSLY